MVTLELCTDSLEGVLAAGKYNLDRVELCSALEVGGLTPDVGLVKACVDANCVDIHAMLRPKGGGFVYDSDEIRIMETNLKAFAEHGVKGIVFGVLNSRHEVSIENKQLVDLAKSLNLEATFHRAFDLSVNKYKAAEYLIDLGFDRVLTSGGAKKALDGIELLRSLEANFGKQLEILAGSGVTAENAPIFKRAGIRQLHFTARSPLHSGNDYGFGTQFVVNESKIESIIESLK